MRTLIVRRRVGIFISAAMTFLARPDALRSQETMESTAAAQEVAFKIGLVGTRNIELTGRSTTKLTPSLIGESQHSRSLSPERHVQQLDARYKNLTDELDVARFSSLVPVSGAVDGIQRILGSRRILTVAGGNVYFEPRTANQEVTWIGMTELFPAEFVKGASLVANGTASYDLKGERWAVVSHSDSQIFIALSKSEDPADGWDVYRLDSEQTLASPIENALIVFGSTPVVAVGFRESIGRPKGKPGQRITKTFPFPEGQITAATVSYARGIGTQLSNLPYPVTVSPNSGAGTSKQFIVTYSDPSGAFNISSAQFLINSTLSGASACWVWYSGATNQLGLANDAGSSITYASSGTLSNSQCTLDVTSSFIQRSGTSLIINPSLSFTSAFSGTKALYVNIADANGASGWEVLGSWNVPTGNVAPGPVSISPSSGSGLVQTFTAGLTDPYGASAITLAQVLFNSSLNGAGACWIQYTTSTGKFTLVNDAGTAVIGSISPGTNTSLSNSQCTLFGTGSVVSPVGNTLSVQVQVTFNGASFGGGKTSYVQATAGSVSSGWEPVGNWVVPNTNAPPSVTYLTPSSGGGSTGTFSAYFNYAGGAAAISQAQILFNSTLSGASACWIWYSQGNQIGLANDAGTAVNYATVGTGVVLQNSQCSFSTSNVFVTIADAQLNVFITPVSFTPAFGGTKAIYMQVNVGGSGSGWGVYGNWTVPTTAVPPGPILLTPTSGSGTSQVFSETVTAVTGGASVTNAQLLFNTTLNSTNACWVWYNGNTNQLGLANDAGTSVTYGTTFTNATIQNSQCVLNLINSSVSVSSSSTVTINASLLFLNSFTGTKAAYGQAAVGSLASGWELLGTWTPQ